MLFPFKDNGFEILGWLLQAFIKTGAEEWTLTTDFLPTFSSKTSFSEVLRRKIERSLVMWLISLGTSKAAYTLW